MGNANSQKPSSGEKDSKNPGNCPRGSQKVLRLGCWRKRLEDPYLRKHRRHSRKQIKGQKSPATYAVFEGRTKGNKIKKIPDEMKPVAVDKAGRKRLTQGW